jgi:hypothetical protein
LLPKRQKNSRACLRSEVLLQFDDDGREPNFPMALSASEPTLVLRKRPAHLKNARDEVSLSEWFLQERRVGLLIDKLSIELYLLNFDGLPEGLYPQAASLHLHFILKVPADTLHEKNYMPCQSRRLRDRCNLATKPGTDENVGPRLQLRKAREDSAPPAAHLFSGLF